MTNKFTWGDPVLINKSAPEKYRPGEYASVCGFSQILNESEADFFNCNVGDWRYIVEYADGSSVEIPEHHLERYNKE